ncbi:hypothetical protein [Streptomyces sp. CB01881]|uniref:hypothetical protein n=1 Tax=Streptomyces sp. CB01881 TaxID=2078691 RepID=UPI000CDC5D89|nr:hypothetical protein [Streptomyces sp. CB01881]AUY50984.1 hypothetical protein C2142_20855 [Streptomyces sp. CB01881]TYC74369.1 hypothetical protein EH183_20820 [Streptomyces sp. CB01881]
MSRMRLRFNVWPKPAIELTDTPDPHCPDCQGEGGWTEDYGDYDTGEYAGTEDVWCTCWNPDQVRRLLPIPRWIVRHWLSRTMPVYSDEPLF